ncbi:hypothetical protein GCM10010121_039040 [Streptomyces brasiliensis]|uniref:Uncharacterized protein n=1 Tax=Streptomyces brasiliensis TaxID=1954 RepID=A0A917KQ69_9ACTN|nr:hypothetical protein GCM10010121_039040 [Streptomyces brasiliensis]
MRGDGTTGDPGGFLVGFHRPGRTGPCSQPLFRFLGATAVGPDGAVSYLGMTAGGGPEGETRTTRQPLEPPGEGGREQVEPPRSYGEIPSFRVRASPAHVTLLASADGLFHGLMLPQTSIK